jgi:hypothetical protein
MQPYRRLPPRILAIALSVFVAIAPLSAIGPSLLMFYGGDLKEPIFVFPGNPSYNPTSFIWSPVNGGVTLGSGKRGTLPPNLEGRRYVSVAIFWGPSDATGLKPSDASQHGRIYLPTASAPAAIVITFPNMANSTGGPPQSVPIPTSLAEFIAGWTLSPEQTAQLRQLARVF